MSDRAAMLPIFADYLQSLAVISADAFVGFDAAAFAASALEAFNAGIDYSTFLTRIGGVNYPKELSASLEGTWTTWRGEVLGRYAYPADQETVLASQALARYARYQVFQQFMWNILDSQRAEIVRKLAANARIRGYVAQGRLAFVPPPGPEATQLSRSVDEEYNAKVAEEKREKWKRIEQDKRNRSIEERENRRRKQIVSRSVGKTKANLLTKERQRKQQERSNVRTISEILQNPGRATYSVKGVGSMLEKMIGDLPSIVGNPKIVHVEAHVAGMVRDAMRATFTVPSIDDLPTVINVCLNGLRSSGCDPVKVVNNINKPAPTGYRGVNSQWQYVPTKDDWNALDAQERAVVGPLKVFLKRPVYFEVQFHTKLSFAAKDLKLLHDLYQAKRVAEGKWKNLVERNENKDEISTARAEVDSLADLLKAENTRIMRRLLPSLPDEVADAIDQMRSFLVIPKDDNQ